MKNLFRLHEDNHGVDELRTGTEEKNWTGMVRRLEGWLAKEEEYALFYLVSFAHFGAGFRLLTIKPNITVLF